MTRRRVILLVLLLFLLPLLAGTGAAAWFLLSPTAPPRETVVTVPPGEAFTTVAGRLAGAGIVRSAAGLRLLARLRGDGGRIQAGEYAFAAPATPGEVLDRLTRGDVVLRRVTIPEGWTVRQIAARLAAEGLADAGAIADLAADPRFARSLDLEAEGLEGYLFPETYLLPAGTPAERILAAMVRQFRERLEPGLVAAAAERGLTLHELVTLASIVQKEAGNVAEMPRIAAVFHNRLARNMPLQADPTVIYGIPDFDGNLTRAHLETETPYNTYRRRGLPPGPIASPGLEALRAAARPAASDDLYFVARGDGTHSFSATLREHNRAVQRYQLRR